MAQAVAILLLFVLIYKLDAGIRCTFWRIKKKRSFLHMSNINLYASINGSFRVRGNQEISGEVEEGLEGMAYLESHEPR